MSKVENENVEPDDNIDSKNPVVNSDSAESDSSDSVESKEIISDGLVSKVKPEWKLKIESDKEDFLKSSRGEINDENLVKGDIVKEDVETVIEEPEVSENVVESSEIKAVSAEHVTRGEIRSKKKRSKGVAIVASIAGVAALAGVAFVGTNAYNDSKTTIVPAATKSIAHVVEVDDSCKIFVEANLGCVISWKTDEVAERGAILSQSLATGEKVDKDSKVVLTYSSGPAVSEFPNFKNVTLDDTKNQLYGMGVEVQEVKEIDGSALDSGKVVSTSIKAGDKVNNGDSVIIEVSNGKVKLPDWKGKTKEYVETDAEKLGVKVAFTEEENSGASGIVMSQTPGAGETTTSTEVKVVISKAFKAQEIKIPDVIGKTAEEAQTELATVGFRHIKTVQVKNSEVTEKQVTQIVPGVGQTGNSEENIVIIVSEPSK